MEASKNPLELAALATVAIPGMEVTEVFGPQVQEPGRSSTRIRDARGGTWTVTVTEEELTIKLLQQRQEVLKFLQSCSSSDLLPFSVPQLISWAQTDNSIFAVLYSVTSGHPVAQDEVNRAGLLSGSLARSLASLHNLEPRALTELGTPTLTVIQAREGLRTGISSVGRELPGLLRKRWLCAVDEDVLWGFDPTPTHGELSLDAVLTSHDAVRSITGWERLILADPATDLAWLLPIVSDDFLTGLIDAYSVARNHPDLHIFTRAQLYSELALLDWLRFGMETGDRDIVNQATQMLLDLDADLSGAMLVEPTRPVVQLHFEAADEPLNRIRRAEVDEDQETQPHSPEYISDDYVDPAEAETEAIVSVETSVHGPAVDSPRDGGLPTHSYEYPQEPTSS